MVDPFNVTKYDRTDRELEEFFFFCVFVAGKNAVQTAQKTHSFYMAFETNQFRFTQMNLNVQHLLLEELARKFRLGKYETLSKFFKKYVRESPDLRTITVEELMEYPGIGPKTARFFILHSRPGANVAVLDTHILKFLRERGLNAPKSTPTGRTYDLLEDAFLQIYRTTTYESVAEFDLDLWKRYRNG